ncbi:small GTP-binding [Babesia ovis]|uniref:Small GTP-binding n=1 Tax=Babesia ovis TaxID=5869 RepID=A0A9W5T940_BABOV|nr:small GTP-binding [Babesia ovis]
MSAKKSYKTVLLGDASVGKSSFAVRLTRGEFSDSTNSTIGAAFFTHTVRCNAQGSKGPGDSSVSGKDSRSHRSSQPASSPDDAPAGQVAVKFDIWDTAGQERFKSIAPIYYRGAACAIVILDISSPPSLQHAVSWVDQIRVANSNQTLTILVANKVDLLGTKDEYEQTLANARAYAKDNGLMLVETSAKTGQNISQVFELLAQEIQRNPQRYEKPSATNTTRALNVDDSRSRMLRLKCCDSF